jgi:hypothetical protein
MAPVSLRQDKFPKVSLDQTRPFTTGKRLNAQATDRHRHKTHLGGKLHTEMPETANAEDGGYLAGSRAPLLRSALKVVMPVLLLSYATGCTLISTPRLASRSPATVFYLTGP